MSDFKTTSNASSPSLPDAPDLSHLHPTVRDYVTNREVAEGYDRCFSGNSLFEFDCLFIEKNIPPAARLLDLGCGTGRHVTYFAAKGCDVTGVDLNPHMLREAEMNCAAAGVTSRLLCADLAAPPLDPAETFDGILLMFSTLGLVESHERRRALLKSLRSRIRPGGCLLFHVHNQNHHYQPPIQRYLESGRNLAKKLVKRDPGDTVMRNYRGILDLYCHLFTESEIRALLLESAYTLRELLPLNEERSGEYESSACGFGPNGFLVAASPE